MVWTSRQDKLPPPSYFSQIVEHLRRAYRGARISREMMQALRPFFIEAWRNGATADAAAQRTCSCDGREVVPSPAVGVQVARGEVRAPKGAERGEVFGADELRPPAAVERLERKLQQIEQRQKKEQSVATRWRQREQTARKDFVRAEAAQRIGGATQRYAALREEAQRIEEELRRVRAELGRVGRGARALDDSSISTSAISTSPTSAPSETDSGPASAKAPRRARKASAASSTPETVGPGADPQAAAMLASIRGLLPEVAGQLAAQMKKEGGRS